MQQTTAMTKNKILTAKFEPDNNDSFSFLISLESEELKRKRCYISVTFKDHATDKPVKIARNNEFTQFANAVGDIYVTAAVKKEVFMARPMRVTIPYELFSELNPSRRIIAKVALVVRDNEQEAESEHFDLMVNLGKKFTTYSLDKYAKYLRTTGSDVEKLSFSTEQLLNGKLDKDVFVAVLDLLNDLAQAGSGQAQYELYCIYKDEKYGVFDAVTAINFLKKAAEAGYPPAVKEIENSKNLEEMKSTDSKSSMDLYRKAAQEGNTDAQYTMFEYLSSEGEHYDMQQAAFWLKRAAENGHNEAIKKLYNFFSDAYVSEAAVSEYLDIVSKAAEKNCGEAQLALFEAYFSGSCMGREVKTDKKYAADCLLGAAKNGCAEACYKIWSLYVGGNDMLMEEPTAVEWLKKAADAMVPAALNDLGDLYVEGKSIEKDGRRGIDCILKAAELENPDAQMRVLAMYRDGRYKDVLIEEDMERALDCLINYARGGNPLAQLTLWVLYQEDNEMLLTRQEAIGWLEQADKQDYYPASYELANVLLTGEYTDVDTKKAFLLLEKASKNGEVRAQYALYQLYYTGEFYALKSELNKERSYKWLLLSAQSYNVAQFQMWVMFRSGNEMELESTEALRYLFEAVKNQYPAAMYDLGLLYIKGEMVSKNVEKGISFIESAKKLRFPKAIYMLSKIRAEGICEGEQVAKDEGEALRLLKLSAEFGYAPACYEIWEQFTQKNGFPIEATWAKKLLENAASQGYQPAVKALKSPDEEVKV